MISFFENSSEEKVMEKIVSLVLVIILVLLVSSTVLADCHCRTFEDPNFQKEFATCICDLRSKCVLLGCSDGSIGHIGNDIKGKPLYYCPAGTIVTYTVVDNYPCSQNILDNEGDFIPNLRF